MLLRTLAAAGLPATGRFLSKAGWVSRVWVGDECVVRLIKDRRHRDAYRHEATVVSLLAGSEVPHARILAHGDGPDGPWYVSERLPGRTLYEAWPAADSATRRAMIEHHPQPDARDAAQDRIARVLSGHNHLDGLVWQVAPTPTSCAPPEPGAWGDTCDALWRIPRGRADPAQPGAR